MDQKDKVCEREGEEVVSGGDDKFVASDGDYEFVASDGDNEPLVDERDNKPKKRNRTPKKPRRNARSTRNEKNTRTVDNIREVKPARNRKRMNGRKTIPSVHFSSDSESSKEDSAYETKQPPKSKPFRSRRHQNAQPVPPRKSPRLHNHVDYRKMLE